MTTEDGVLLRENAVHTHPLLAKCKLRWMEWCKRFGYVGKMQSDTKM